MIKSLYTESIPVTMEFKKILNTLKCSQFGIHRGGDLNTNTLLEIQCGSQ